MMRPPRGLWSFMIFMASWVHRNGPVRLAATTESQVLAHITTTPNGNGGKPLVFRTSFSTTKGSGKPGTPTPALMVVVPDQADSDGHVDFVDPTTYRELDSVDYTGAGGSGGSATS